MNQPVVSDLMRQFAEAYVESCRYVAEQRGEPFDAEKATEQIRTALTVPRPRHPHDDFEPVEPDMSDPGFEGADQAEARETKWREGS